MTVAQWITAALLVVTLAAQALVPSKRIVIVTAGAAVSVLGSTLLGVSNAARIFDGIPWDVLVIVVSLGLLSEAIGASRLFGILAVAATRVSRADPLRVLALFAVGMYAVSGLVNNLTALLLVLPVLLSLLKLQGVSQRYVSWTLGMMLVACNLGGAATPIGDFPAILLLGRGAMGFNEYLVRALPQTVVAMVVFLVLGFVLARPARGLARRGLSMELARRTMEETYRGVRIDRTKLAIGGGALAAMLAGWSLIPPSWGVGPELVAWLGVAAALLAMPTLGEQLARRRVDVEAVLFLLSLFVLVGAVRESGTFALAARELSALPVPPKAQVVIFFVVAAVVTALFSAGPGMAALLEVAAVLATRHPPAAIYVGLAMSVCAGSSLFLTAATAGPLAQSLTERTELREPSGASIRFGFVQHLPVGVVGFAVTLATGITFALFSLD